LPKDCDALRQALHLLITSTALTKSDEEPLTWETNEGLVWYIIYHKNYHCKNRLPFQYKSQYQPFPHVLNHDRDLY
jgi:hypothetical protein